MLPSRSVLVGGLGKDELRLRLRQAGVQLNPLGEELFGDERFQVSVQPLEFEVVQVSVAELGFHQGAGFDEICLAAGEQDLDLCPLELGPYLRLAFLDQPEADVDPDYPRNCAPPGSLTVASLPISEDDDFPKGFYLRVIDGVPWLRGYRSWPGHVWSPGDVFAFVKRPGV